MSSTLRRAGIAFVVAAVPALASTLGFLGDAFALRHILYVDAPIHDGTLSDVERSVVTSAFADYNSVDSNATIPETFEDLLLRQNTAFQDALRTRLANDDTDLLLVHAPGGYGKTSLMEDVARNLADGDFEIINLTDYCEPPLRQMACPTKPDLFLAGNAVNELPDLPFVEYDRLIDDTAHRTTRLVLFDSLDEIHPDSAKAFLRTLVDRLASFGTTDVLLFARSELANELIASDDPALIAIARVPLNPHSITRASLRLRVKNYLDFYASSRPDSQHGIVSGINDADTVDKLSAALHNLITSRPYLVDMLRLAFLSSLLMQSQFAGDTSSGIHIHNSIADYRDVDVRQFFSRQVRERAEDTHGRPTNANSHYYNALAAVARDAEPDSNGLFPMSDGQTNAPDPGGDGQFVFESYRPLRRSGLVSFIPAARSTSIRFEPVWLQSALVNGANWPPQKTLSFWRLAGVGGLFVGLWLATFVLQTKTEPPVAAG